MIAEHAINPLTDMANWAASTPRNWSAKARQTVQHAMIDICACMIPGAREDTVQKLWSAVRLWGDGDARVVGFDKSLSAPWAALVNGTSAHALDFDDIFDPAKAHATAVIMPALLAIADTEDKSVDDLVDAYIVGLQILGLAGQGMNPYHRLRGWHATSTLGTLGAAAGCARLLGLDAEATANAISMSTSLAGGFMSQFGSDTKPLHAGFAAAGGVQAALLARAGLTAGRETLDGKTGMRTLMVGQDVEILAESMKGREEYGQSVSFRTPDIGKPLHAEKYGLKIKRFPNCGSVHRALDGLLHLRETRGFTASDVTSVLVRAPAVHLNNLMYDRPATPTQAKFSLEYGLAVGLLSGSNRLSDFTAEAIARPEVRALLPLVRKEYVDKLESAFYTQVHVRLKDGTSCQTEINMPVGSNAAPLNSDQLWTKFDDCLQSVAELASAREIKACLSAFSSTFPVRDLTRALQG